MKFRRDRQKKNMKKIPSERFLVVALIVVSESASHLHNRKEQKGEKEQNRKMVLGQIGEFKRRAPKTNRSRRVMRKQEAKAFENPKKTLFLRSANTNNVVVDAMNDWYNLLKPR